MLQETRNPAPEEKTSEAVKVAKVALPKFDFYEETRTIPPSDLEFNQETITSEKDTSTAVTGKESVIKIVDLALRLFLDYVTSISRVNYFKLFTFVHFCRLIFVDETANGGSDIDDVTVTYSPVMQSTQISDNMESFQLEDTSEDKTSESTAKSENITGYQRGHSMSFVQNQFDFLSGSSSSIIRRELSTKRNPADILKEVEGRRVCFEAESPKLDSTLKKRQSLCVGGSADDMALEGFNPKSLQSFRKTQRLKRYEAKATASSLFKTSESGNNLVRVDAQKRKKDLEEQIQDMAHNLSIRFALSSF